MRALAIAGSLSFFFAAGAGAAEPPSLIGDWTRTGFSLAQVGESPGYTPSTKPVLVHGTDPDWKMRIDRQEGASFAGTLTGPNGRSETILGTFQQDGKRFVFSTAHDTGSGVATRDELEYCWTTSSARFVSAGCAIYKRNK
jgi:hypothetical protein